MNFIVEIFAGILPVFIFLLLLIGFDSFKLVKGKLVWKAVLSGFISALLSLGINNFLRYEFNISYYDLSVEIAPPVEEIIKTSFFVFFVLKGRVGFMIDGAIIGFAIGAGFAAVENFLFVYNDPNHRFIVYLVRGIGTAVMHSGVTSISSIVTMYLINRKQKTRLIYFLPGMLIAIIIHMIYNQFFIDPLLSSVIIVILIPALSFLIFHLNEKSLSSWLDMEFDEEVELLKNLNRGKFTGTKAGEYFFRIKHQFKPEVVFDMLCYLQLYLELSIRAKSVIMQKEQGIEPKYDKSIEPKIRELDFLQKSIGRSGRLALKPILSMNQKQLWKINLLK